MEKRFLYLVAGILFTHNPLSAHAIQEDRYERINANVIEQSVPPRTHTQHGFILQHIQTVRESSRVSLLAFPVERHESVHRKENIYLSTDVFGSIRRPGAGINIKVIW